MLPMISLNPSLSCNNKKAQNPAITARASSANETFVDGKKRRLWVMVSQPVNWQIKPRPAKHNQVFPEKTSMLPF